MQSTGGYFTVCHIIVNSWLSFKYCLLLRWMKSNNFFCSIFFFFYFLGFSFGLGVSGSFASIGYLSMLFQESQKSILISFKIYIDSYSTILHAQATRGPKARESYLFPLSFEEKWPKGGNN